MRPIAQSDGHDAPWLVDELVPSVAAVVYDVVIRFEDAVGEPVVAHELPDVFRRVQFRTFWRQGQDGDICGHGELVGCMPSGLIDEKNGVRVWRDILGDFGKMKVHRQGIAYRQDKGCALAFLGADGAEDVR